MAQPASSARGGAAKRTRGTPARRATGEAPEILQALVDRFDPTVFDAPGGTARIRLDARGGGTFDAVVKGDTMRLEPASPRDRADALLGADVRTWATVTDDYQGGMDAYRTGALLVRRNLHLAIGFLTATSGSTEPGRLKLGRVETPMGSLATLEAGTGDPLVMLHGLGATKASFVPTIAALASESRRMIAVDLPGFGDSVKPLGARYHAPFFARSVVGLLDALELDRPDVLGHSMGGRVAIDMGIRHPDRVARLVLMTPALAWRRQRRWAPWLKLVRPELGLIQPTNRRAVEAVVRRLVPGAENAWVAAAVDEFLRSFLTPRGRAAFYAAARQIYLEEPDGPRGFWARLAEMSPEALFIWGKRDTLVPIGFARHVEGVLPEAKHVELSCGHVPQLERPKELHGAINKFLRARPRVG